MTTAIIQKEAECTLPTTWGEFIMTGYREITNNREHVALRVGKLDEANGVLVRVHSECLTGDALFSQRCDCGPQLQTAMQLIQEQGSGVIVYLRQEGRGIGLLNKIKAYHLQEQGLDTVSANLALHLPIDARDFTCAKEILQDLGVNKIRLMTNNPDKIQSLERLGIEITERIPLQVGVQEHNYRYLNTKADKLGHLLNLPPK